MELRYWLAQPLIPVWRDRDTLQLGLRGALVLTHVPPETPDLLIAMRRPLTHRQLERKVPSLSSSWIDFVLSQLDSHGLLCTDAVRGLKVAIFGPSPVADDIFQTLNDRLPGSALLVDREDEPSLVPRRYLELDGHPWPELTVFATEVVEPDRSLTDQFYDQRRTCLIVRLAPSVAIVGPLIIPGQSSCLRCQDLFLAEADHSYPELLAQLCRYTVAETPLLLRQWACATACAQVNAYLEGHHTEGLSRTKELGTADFTVHETAIPIHPRCTHHDLWA
ncbi:MAG: hypothetical protein LBR20_05845 [Propionibacteriaceae bacterium]|jgi:hypothetical protein|nr:hypothetical protein [Propionibacteriaceae bacterium]